MHSKAKSLLVLLKFVVPAEISAKDLKNNDSFNECHPLLAFCPFSLFVFVHEINETSLRTNSLQFDEQNKKKTKNFPKFSCFTI